MHILYENIKRLRKDLNMNQEDLSNLIGYTNRSIISKIEKGEVDLSILKIIAFAKALGVSPIKLLGWEDLSDIDITYKEKLLISAYREKKELQNSIDILLDLN